MREVCLAAVQSPNIGERLPPRERRRRNIEVAWELLERAAAGGADLICLPETFPVVGCTGDAVTYGELADTEDGALCRDLSVFARRHRTTVVAPVLGRYGAELRNATWVISGAAGLVGRYFKVHPTRGERERGIVPGDEWPVFDLGLMRLGVMVCHDNSFPESARCLALGGAEVLCWPHVQSGWGDLEWDITLRSRAIDNAVHLVSSCPGVPVGEAWRPGMMVGRSGVVGADGTVLADAGRQAGVARATVDLDRAIVKWDFSLAGPHDFRALMRADRRPDTYGAVSATPVSVLTEGEV